MHIKLFCSELSGNICILPTNYPLTYLLQLAFLTPCYLISFNYDITWFE